MIDDASEPKTGQGGTGKIHAGNHAGREHRFRPKIYPERQREPNREVRYGSGKGVAEDVMEWFHIILCLLNIAETVMKRQFANFFK